MEYWCSTMKAERRRAKSSLVRREKTQLSRKTYRGISDTRLDKYAFDRPANLPLGAAQRPRTEPLGGLGKDTFILGPDDGERTMSFEPARRVGSNEM